MINFLQSYPFTILYFFVLQYGACAFLNFSFFRRYTDSALHKGCMSSYILLSYLLTALELEIHPAPISVLFYALRIGLLAGFGVFFMRCRPSAALFAGVLTYTLQILISGVLTPLTFLTMPMFSRWLEPPVMLWISLLPMLASLAFLYVSYEVVLRKLKLAKDIPSQYLAVYFVPIFLLLLVEQYVSNQVYGDEIIVSKTEILKPVADHGQILLIQLFAFCSLFCVLFACRKLADAFALQTRRTLLEQQIHIQREYLREAKLRIEHTRAWRHDMKNHLGVVDGLLASGQQQQAHAYLKSLESVAFGAFQFQTNRPAVDVLLDSKLGLAHQSGIKAECALRFPDTCQIEDLDLCVVISNALDNAINACAQVERPSRFVRVTGKWQGDFFMLEILNSCHAPSGPIRFGTGLCNIKAVAEKYRGAVHVQCEQDTFLLSVLFINSPQVEDISRNLY